MIRDVPIETVFVPRTRKEIKCCEWFSIDHLPTHKTDQVSRNHLGINANSFFMIMPFVKRLKKWINEQSIIDNPMSKKSKDCDSKHMMMAGVISNSNATMITLNDQNDDNKTSNMVFFKNNRRQRHKSMGDFDSTNVVALYSTGDTQSQLTTPINNGNKINNGLIDGINGVNKIIGGKRKLFANDSAHAKRSLSPFASNFQLQPVPNNLNGNGMAKQMPQYILLKPEHSTKKKIDKQNDTNEQQNGDDMEHKLENECQSSGQQRWPFNPPKLSQFIGNEPNIANWSNVRLNKDSIMHESLKSTRKMTTHSQ